ncbi:MAG: DEAD/DEAH box helicase family protein [Bacteroidales bacterium]|nr:DEAD/DEAH box helicase family protein [Bacteroidales bacterium]
MITLKDYQRKAVDELKRKMIDMLNDSDDRQKLVFKAPTGAGKTVMTSCLLDEMTQELPYNGECKHAQVAWVWIAPNKLHQQSYRSMRNFFSEKRSLRPVMFDECDHLEGLHPGDVLFLNWESINKDNAVLIRDNERSRTLYELIRKTKVEKHIPVVVVIDEEHMFAGRNAKKSELVLRSIQPKVELRISATPVTQTYNAVMVKRQDVVAEEMTKKGVELNPNVKGSKEQSAFTINQQLLEKALKKRNELAKAYAQYDINPLLLIQLPNDSSDALSAGEKTIAEEMKVYLDTQCGISEENGRLACWLSKDKSPNLANITKANDMTEVLLFKQAIALGWDCPRASVLLIFRELESVTFTTQTVGRILRMPEQRFYQNDVLNHGYVYTNLSKDIIQIVQDDMNYLSTVEAQQRRDLVNITLPSVYMDKNKAQRNRLGSTFRKVFFEVMKDTWQLSSNYLFTLAEMLGDDDEVERKDGEQVGGLSPVQLMNRRELHKKGIETDVARIMVEIPKDTHITKLDGQVEITDKARIAMNAYELDALFKQFCRRNVGSFSKYDSMPVLKGAIESALEDYLGVFETEVPKIVLYHANRPQFEDIIKSALLRYTKTQEKQQAAEKRYVEYIWQVPEQRPYNSNACTSREGEIHNHALVPYFEQQKVSAPEYNFARWMDVQNDVVDWWYKNGDEGKQHFAVPYTDSAGQKRCFYVDFIVRLKNSTILLLDTKTCNSDDDAPEKNNALYNYILAEREKGKKMAGGVLINHPGTQNWYYPDGIIEDTKDTNGWTLLDLNVLNNK